MNRVEAISKLKTVESIFDSLYNDKRLNDALRQADMAVWVDARAKLAELHSRTVELRTLIDEAEF